MIRTQPVSLARVTAVCLAVLACIFSSTAALAAGAEPTIKYQPESFATYQAQLAAGKVKAVTINKRVRSLRLTLKDGSYVLAKYKPHEEKKIAAGLEAKGVAISVLQPSEAAKEVVKKPAKHKLRYIAAAVLIVVILGVGLVLYVDRKRKRERE